MDNKHYVGKRVSSLVKYGETEKITGIALLVDDDNQFLAGDQDGYVLEVTCPYGTQEMANKLLEQVGGKSYVGFSANSAIISPDAELGDGITIDGVYSPLASKTVKFGALNLTDIGAPGDSELNHEYEYISSQQSELNRKFSKTRSYIDKTADQIKIGVQGLEDQVSNVEGQVSDVEGHVSDVEDHLSEIEVTADKINWLVKSGSSSSNLQLTDEALEVIANNITLKGYVTFTDLSDKGKSTINGSNITTGTIDASLIRLEGNYGGFTQGIGAWRAGSSGATTTTYGALMYGSNGLKSNKEAYPPYFLVTNTGVRAQISNNRYFYMADDYFHLIGHLMIEGGCNLLLDNGSAIFSQIRGSSSYHPILTTDTSNNTFVGDSSYGLRLQGTRIVTDTDITVEGSGHGLTCRFDKSTSDPGIWLIYGSANYFGGKKAAVVGWENPTRINGSEIFLENSPTYGSDRDVKKDIAALPDKYIGLLRQMEPALFRYKREDDDGPLHAGYIAQEMEQAIARAGMGRDEVAALFGTDGTGEMGIRYTELIPMMHLWLRQLEERIKRLEDAA